MDILVQIIQLGSFAKSLSKSPKEHHDYVSLDLVAGVDECNRWLRQ